MRKTPSGLQRLVAGLLCGALVLIQLPPGFGTQMAAADTGTSTASAGSAPPPAATATESFQPDLFTGRATTAIPIAVPPGRKGVQPSLALSYSSSSRNGWVGVGWALDLGYIERSTKTGVPSYDDSKDTFTFLFQGMSSDLVKISDGTYRAKDEGAFLKFTKNGSTGWEVRDKSGTRYLFGESTASQLANGSQIFRWALDKVLDLNGNTLTLTYTKDQTQLYLAQIDYTGHETNGAQDLAPTNQVLFTLEDRPDGETSYRTGFAVTTAKRLKEVATYAQGQLARKYVLAYTASARTTRSLLSSVTQVGSDGSTSLPPTTFSYTQTPPTYLKCTNCVPSVTNTGNHGWMLQWQVAHLFPHDSTNDQQLWPSGYFQPGYKSWTEQQCQDYKSCHSCWFFATCCDHQTICYDYTQAAAIPPVSWGAPTLVDGGGSGSGGGLSWSISGGGNLSVPSGPQDTHLLAQTWLYSPTGGGSVSLGLGVGGRGNVYYVRPGESGWTAASGDSVPLSAGWTVVAVAAYNEAGGFSLNLTPATEILNQLGSGGAMNNAQFTAMQLDGDFNGDAMHDVAAYDGTKGQWRVTLNSPQGFQQEKAWVFGYGGTSDSPLVGDFDADGKTDVALYNNGAWRFALSNGTSQFTEQASWAITTPSGTPVIGDFNGDGLLDLATYNAGTWSVALNTGNGFRPASAWLSASTDEPLTGDFNGDGLTDIGLVEKSSGNISVAFSTGSTFVIQSGTWITGFGANQSHTTADFNGDGLSDVAYYDKPNGSVIYAPSTGRKFDTAQTLVSGVFSLRSNDDTLQVGDWAGNGLQGPGVKNLVTGQAELAVAGGQLPDLLSQITNGLGGSTSITYSPSSSLDNTGGDGKPDLPFVLSVVTQATSSDGLGNSYTTTYRYSGGKYDPTSKEFWGFADAQVIDPLGTVSETQFLQNEHTKGRPSLQQTTDAQGHLYTKTVNTWSCTDAYPGVHFVHLDQTDAFVYDSNSSFRQSRSRFTYDQYGNLAQTFEDGWVAQSGHDEDVLIGDERSTVTTYVPNPDAWILNRSRLVQTLDASGAVVAQKRLTYDNATDDTIAPAVGNLTKEEEWCNLPTEAWVATTLSYDAYGNVKTITDALSHQTTNDYEATVTYLTRITNALGHTRQLVSDPRTGQVTSSTDQNGVTTTTQYDPLGRLVKVIGPTDTDTLPTVWHEYDLSTVPIKTTTHHRIQSGASGDVTTYTFTDGLGRTIQTRVPAEDPTKQVVTGAVEFDARGQVVKQWTSYFSTTSTSYLPVSQEPSFDTLAAVTYTYDAAGRLVTTTEPDGSVSSISYDDGSVMTTDALGHQAFRTTDAYGRLIDVEEQLEEGSNQTNLPTTIYTYDALGDLMQLADAQGHVTVMTYDSLGRKLAMDDPDMGHWTYAYDAVDNLLQQTDAMGQQLAFTYDPLNRLLQKSASLPAPVVYTYDNQAKAYAKGKLTEIVDGAGNSDFVYDVMGHLIQEQRVVDGTTYTVHRTYDLLGRLATVTYPDGDVLHYVYNAQGGLEQLYADFQDDPTWRNWYITNIDYTAAGQVTKIEYGNGVVSDYTYNPQTLRLDQLVTRNSTLNTLQDFSYQFDAVGNVKSIADAATGTRQDFTYDPLNRLTSAVGPYGSQSHTYDQVGNMTQKAGVAMPYGENGAGPHAVTSTAEGWLMSYDPNGNLFAKGQLDGLQYDYTYDAENRLAQVERWDHSPSTVSVHLEPGWNFITLPVEPDDLHVTAVLASLTYGQDYDQLSRYEATTGIWQTFFNDPGFNEFDTMALGEGYAIHCVNPNGATWTVAGKRLAAIQYRQLATNLNLLGSASNTSLTVSEAFEGLSLGTDYTKVYHWNAKTQSFEVYDGTQQSQFTELAPGEGYWIDTTAAPLWQLPLNIQTTQFAYDGDGGRVSRTTKAGTTYYIGEVWEEAPDGTTTKTILAGSQRIAIERTKPGEPITVEHFWFHGDHLGSSNVVTNEQGAVVQRLTYTPYGEVFSNEGSEDFEQKFTGQRYDADTGLYFFHARYYDPQLGRFIQPDTVVQAPDDPQTLNRYSYVRNNPVRFVDPSGHFFFIFALIAAFMHAAAAAISATVSFLVSTLTTTFSAVSAFAAAHPIWTGAILGGFQGGVSAHQAGGNVFAGIAFGAAAGALAGGLSAYASGTFKALQGTMLGAAVQGGFTGAGAGAASGFAGGKGSARDIAKGMATGALRGAAMAVATYSAEALYTKLVGYEPTWAPGGAAVSKQPGARPIKGDNNWGATSTKVDPNSLLNEGGIVSRMANQVRGQNAVAGMHDTFQHYLDSWGGTDLGWALNVPGMPVAAALTYAALLHQQQVFLIYGAAPHGTQDN